VEPARRADQIHQPRPKRPRPVLENICAALENDRGCPFLTGLGRAPALRCELARKSKTLAHRSKFTSATPLTSDRPTTRVWQLSPDSLHITCRATRRSNERGTATLSRSSGCGWSLRRSRRVFGCPTHGPSRSRASSAGRTDVPPLPAALQRKYAGATLRIFARRWSVASVGLRRPLSKWLR
jgi:hypothetical protein